MKLNEPLNDLRAQLAAVKAERDEAQAGEARAVETLRRIHEGATRQLAEPRSHDDDQYALTAIATECEAVSAGQVSALDWLAQREAESVATWIEKQVADNLQRYGTHYYERTTDDLLREAAALRAGKGVGDE